MKYIVGNRIYTSNTVNPHGALKEILINAMLRGEKVEIVKDKP